MYPGSALGSGGLQAQGQGRSCLTPQGLEPCFLRFSLGHLGNVLWLWASKPQKLHREGTLGENEKGRENDFLGPSPWESTGGSLCPSLGQ